MDTFDDIIDSLNLDMTIHDFMEIPEIKKRFMPIEDRSASARQPKSPTDNEFVNDLIQSFELSQIQHDRVHEGKYNGSAKEAQADVSALLNGIESVGPEAKYEHLLAAYTIMQQTLSLTKLNSKRESPWKESDLAKVLAEAMIYWGDNCILAEKEDTARMAYLFALSESSPYVEAGKKGKWGKVWLNACKRYLWSFFYGTNLSAYASEKEQPQKLNDITCVFSKAKIPNRDIPYFTSGLIDLANVLNKCPTEKRKIETALIDSGPYFKKILNKQLAVFSGNGSSPLNSSEALALRLDYAYRKKAKTVNKIEKSLKELSAAQSYSEQMKALHNIINRLSDDLPWSKTDQIKIRIALHFLEIYASAERKSVNRIQIDDTFFHDDLARELLDDVREAPTYFSHKTLVPLLDILAHLWDSLATLFLASFRPKLIWSVESQYQIEKRLYRIQLLVKNERKQSFVIGNSNLTILPDAAKQKVCDARIDSELPHAMSSAFPHEIILFVEISDEAEASGSFPLHISFSYSPQMKEDTEIIEDTNILVIIQQNDFEPIINPYLIYGGGNPIADDDNEMFFGRQSEKQKLIDMLTQDNRMNYGCAVAIYGQTRTGKSSLLRQTQNEVLKTYGDRIVLCDMGNISDIEASRDDPEHFLAEFLYQILYECYNSIGENQSISQLVDFDETEPPLEMISTPNLAVPLFRKYMKRLDKLVRKADAIILITIDEFTYVRSLMQDKKLTTNFMSLWKSILQNYCIFAIVVGQDDMPEFIQEYPNEFACMNVLKLDFLRDEEAMDLVRLPVERSNNGKEIFRPEAVALICVLTSGSAFLIMKYCSHLVEYMNEHHICIAGTGICETFQRDKCFGPNGLFQERHFEPQLSERGHPEYEKETKKLLSYIAQDPVMLNKCKGIKPKRMKFLLKRLISRGVLEKKPIGPDLTFYMIRPPLLTYFLKER